MLASFYFYQPLWFVLLIPISCLMLVLFKARDSQHKDAGRGMIASHLSKVFSLQQHNKVTLKPIILTLVATVLLLTSLAGPSWQKATSDQLKAPLIFALDLSSSMETATASVSSLQQAKLLLDDILNQGVSRPVTLITFAGSSHQVLPPSDQRELLRLYLSYLDPSVMPKNGNDLNSLMGVIDAIPKIKETGFDLIILSDGFEVKDAIFNHWLKDHGASGIIAALTPEGEKSSEKLALSTIDGQDLSPGSDTLYKMIKALPNPSHAQDFTEENLGYWLLYPFALLLLLFFRRGFTLYWSTGLFLLVNLTPQPVEASWLDWVMTPDQQGAYYFKRGDYQEAALRFDDEKWQAAAFYHAREFDKAANIYRQQDDLTSLYNLASSYVKMRNYSKAIGLYQLLLEIEPNNNAVQKDLAIITRLVEEIKRMSESQQEESPPNIVNRDEMMDTSLGADKQKIGQIAVKIEQLSVEELLASDQKKALWLRDISKDPKQFLTAKFQVQYNKQTQDQNGKDFGG